MKLALLVGLGLIGLVLIALLLRSRSGDGPQVTVADIPEGVAHLQQRGREHAFLVYVFVPRERRDGEAINLQYSIDRAQLGLDWVLLSPANIADKPKLEAFVRKQGHAPQEQTVNGVRFLRVEDGDLAALGVQIARELYGLAPSSELGTVVDGFEWTPARSRAH